MKNKFTDSLVASIDTAISERVSDLSKNFLPSILNALKLHIESSNTVNLNRIKQQLVTVYEEVNFVPLTAMTPDDD
jgi:hypothetical protein